MIPLQTHRVGRGIALLFHDCGTRRGWVVSSIPRPHFTPGKDPVPILQEVGWTPGLVWTGRKSRPHRDSIPNHPAHSQSLYHLSYLAHKVRNVFFEFTLTNVHSFMACVGITNTLCSLLGWGLSPAAWWNIIVCLWIGTLGTKSTHTWFSRNVRGKGKFTLCINAHSITQGGDRAKSAPYFLMCMR